MQTLLESSLGKLTMTNTFLTVTGFERETSTNIAHIQYGYNNIVIVVFVNSF